jgi:DNA-binding SARP family transcriptional activator/DNA-binding beta-propeller fold protein YncE
MRGSGAALEFRLLGPLEVWRDGRLLRLGGERQRALLALLLLHTNEVVPTERLIDELFGDDASGTAANALQVGISRLRRVLENGRGSNGESGALVTRPPGYLLRAEPEQLDVARFERLLAEGRQALSAGEAGAAATKFREALALWRGPALADLAPLEFAQSEIRRLEGLRLAALMERLKADLALGRAGEVIPELQALVEANPLQERLRGELMLALYRSGRQADALDVYRQTRELLRDELGLEPSKALQQLERSILRQEASLDVHLGATAAETAEPWAPLQRPPHPRGGLTRRLLAVVALATLAAAIVVAVVLTRKSPSPVVVKPNSIVRIDPRTNQIVQAIPVGRHPSGLTATSEAVWVSNERDRTVSRIDVDTSEVETIGGLAGVGFLTRDQRGNIYASAWDYPFVWRIDPKKVEVVQRYRVRSRAVGLAVGGGSLWVVDRLVNAVTRIDLRRGTVEGSISVGFDPLVATFGFGALWVANSDEGTVSIVRPGVERVETVAVRDKPFGIAAGEGAVWVGSNDWGTITRIDPDTRRAIRHISIGAVPTGLYSVVVGAGSVWVPDWLGNEVIRLDPQTNKVVARIKLAASPRDIAIADGKVWVSVVRPGEDYP